jgi:hypothetical protein
LKLALVRPDFAHLWPGITIDHSGNIKAACLRESVLLITLNPVNHGSVACAVLSAGLSIQQREFR